MIRRAASAVLVLAAVALAACGDDGDKRGASRPTDVITTTTTTEAAGDRSSSTVGAGSPSGSPTTALATTGTTTGATSGDKLAFPQPGVYRFRDVITHDGSQTATTDAYFRITSPAERLARVQETDAAGAPKNAAYYEERHDADGLWLVSSATSGGACDWQPRSASLPQQVIDGKAVTTEATCPAGGSTLRLKVTVEFKAVRNVTVAGRTVRAIDVARRRVLTESDTTITSEAVDTYAFELGLRIAVSERSTTTDARGTRGFTRNLVLEALPS